MKALQKTLAAALVLAAWGQTARAGISDLRTVQTLLFRAVGNEPNVLSMDGTRVVPPSGSFETGTANVSYADPILSYNITHNVSGETSAAIRGPGYGYENAMIQFVLPLGSPKVGSVMLSLLQETYLLDGRLYIEIRSAAFPNGAIRTQIQAVNPPAVGRAVWARVQIQNLGPDPYDGVDGPVPTLRVPGIAAPALRGTRVTVDIDEPTGPNKPWGSDRIQATTSKEFRADIPVGVTIEFDLGYLAYFPTNPSATTVALAETDSLNTDPNPSNNTVVNVHQVQTTPVPAAGSAALAILAATMCVYAVRTLRRRRAGSHHAWDGESFST